MLCLQVVLDRPEKVEELARELVYAGADMCQAFTVRVTSLLIPVTNISAKNIS